MEEEKRRPSLEEKDRSEKVLRRGAEGRLGEEEGGLYWRRRKKIWKEVSWWKERFGGRTWKKKCLEKWVWKSLEMFSGGEECLRKKK